jgi:hypothetical protein
MATASGERTSTVVAVVTAGAANSTRPGDHRLTAAVAEVVSSTATGLAVAVGDTGIDRAQSGRPPDCRRDAVAAYRSGSAGAAGTTRNSRTCSGGAADARGSG